MIENYFAIFALITSGIVGVVGAVFTVRSSLIRSNQAALKELLSTVTAQRDNAEEELEKANARERVALQQVAKLQGENKTLLEIARQTPQIIALTKEVSRNNKSMASVGNEIANVGNKIANLAAVIEENLLGGKKHE